MRERKGLTFVNTVPTAETRVGNFAISPIPGAICIRIYDPLTTRLNPAFRRHQAGERVQPAVSCATRSPATSSRPTASTRWAATWPASIRCPTRRATSTTTPSAPRARVRRRRIHHPRGSPDLRTATRSSSATASRTFRLNAPQGQANCCLPTPADAAQQVRPRPLRGRHSGDATSTTQGMAINETHVFRPNLINEFRGGFARTNPFTTAIRLRPQRRARRWAFRASTSPQFSSGIPNINVADFTGLSGGPGFLPANPRETHWQIEDGIAWTLGRHQTKFGYRYIRRMTSPYTGPPGGGPRGDMTFGRNFTNDPVTNTQGTGLATLLIGYISGGGGRSILLEPYYTTNQDHGFYFQDDWKIVAEADAQSRRAIRHLRARRGDPQPPRQLRPDQPEAGLRRRRRHLQHGGQGDPLRQLRPADRLGLRRRRARARPSFAAATPSATSPSMPSGSNMLGEQVPYIVSQTPFGNIPVNPTNYRTSRPSTSRSRRSRPSSRAPRPSSMPTRSGSWDTASATRRPR